MQTDSLESPNGLIKLTSSSLLSSTSFSQICTQNFCEKKKVTFSEIVILSQFFKLLF